MSHKKLPLNTEDLRVLLAAAGCMFPRNETELELFETLSIDEGDVDDADIQTAIRADEIVQGTLCLTLLQEPAAEALDANQATELRMVARNGKATPGHILDKMRENQQKRGK